MRHPLLEISGSESDGGVYIGKDPRKIFPEQFADSGVRLMPVMKAIRAKCIDCCAGQVAEVRKCASFHCPLWPMRMGNFPRKLRAALKAEDTAEDDSE